MMNTVINIIALTLLISCVSQLLHQAVEDYKLYYQLRVCVVGEQL